MRRPLTFRNVNLSGSSSDGESTQTNTNGTSNSNIGTGITSDHSHSNSLSSQFIKTTQAMIARVSNVHGRNSTASISAQSGPRTSQLILPRSIKKRLKLVFIMTFAAALIFYQDTLTFSSNGSSNSKHNHHYSSVYSNSKHGGTKNSNGGGRIHIRKSSSMLGSSRTLRQGNLQIAKTPYVSPKQALNEMPPLDNGNENGNGKMPSHLALCQELIQRNNVSYQHKEAAAARARNLNAQNMDMDTNNNQNAMGNGNGNGLEDLGLPPPPVFTKFTVHESSELCKDYKHPHSAIMQIISSSIIAYVGKRFGLNYVHNCHSTIKLDGHGDGNDLDFDITTVQQVFPQATMPVNERELKLGHVVHSLCQSCIHEYHNDHQRRERQMQMNANANVNGPDGILDPHQKAHHCLSFPLLQNVHEDTIRVQQVNQEHPDMPEIHLEQHILDQEGHLVRTGLAAVLPLVRNRLNHAAMDWANRARIPSHDPRSGAVIYLDAGDSMAVPFWVIQKYVKQDATHVSILSGPDCARETLKGHISCIQYVLELKDYLTNHYKDKGVEVTFNLVSSTATAYTRMILAHTLVCLPGTISCLLPALSKPKSKTAVILESPQEGADTFHWFTALGNVGDAAGNVNVVTLNPDELTIDQEQQTLNNQYSGFSVDEIVGVGGGNGQGNGHPPPQHPAGPAPAQMQKVTNLMVSTSNMNKNSAPKSAAIGGYQLIDNANTNVNVNANANANANEDNAAHAQHEADMSTGNPPTPDRTNTMTDQSSTMLDDGQVAADIEERFGKGSYLFGSDEISKTQQIETKGTGDNNADSTATATVESQPAPTEQKAEDASPDDSKDTHLSDAGTNKEKEEPLEDEFAGLFGGGR